MYEILYWLFLLNIVFLIMHEIDSAYWKEWYLLKEMLKLPVNNVNDNKEIQYFLLLHLPLLLIFLWGFSEFIKNNFPGLIISLILSLLGIYAFVFHMIFIIKGRHGFRTPVSIFILASVLVLSIFQGILTIALMAK